MVFLPCCGEIHAGGPYRRGSRGHAPRPASQDSREALSGITFMPGSPRHHPLYTDPPSAASLAPEPWPRHGQDRGEVVKQ